jgi:hypothetical protein
MIVLGGQGVQFVFIVKIPILVYLVLQFVDVFVECVGVNVDLARIRIRHEFDLVLDFVVAAMRRGGRQSTGTRAETLCFST